MKYTILLILVLLACDSCLCANEPVPNKDSFEVSFRSSGPSEQKPNIIFILVDDLGKEWIGCYGGQNIETPNVDALAASGLVVVSVEFELAWRPPPTTPHQRRLAAGSVGGPT